MDSKLHSYLRLCVSIKVDSVMWLYKELCVCIYIYSVCIYICTPVFKKKDGL